MKINFVTGNEHKAEEAALALKPYGIEVERIEMDKPETKDESIYDVSRKAAKFLSDKLKMDVVVEDTGIFFHAFKNFPGPHSKFVYDQIGYEGMFKLLNGKEKSASMRVVASYCPYGKDPVTFEGRVNGTITDKVHGEEIKVMPYDRIFIPDGYDQPFCYILDIKQKISHRKEAFAKLGEYLTKKEEK